MAKKVPPKKPNKDMPKGLARALAERKANADSEALLADMIEVWGGTRQLALDLYAEFQGAAKGGMTRQRILEMIQRLIVTNTTHEIGRTIRPSDLTDDELEDLAMGYVRKVTAKDGPAPAA
jgi:hypothetical protein